jgi:hypothetical protein
MKLINLIPLREADDVSTPELIATPFFREFQTKHGYKPLFKFLGAKGEEMIFTADVNDFGMLDLIIKDAQIMAKVTEKEAVFGMIYTLTGLEKSDATICKMKQKDGVVEVIMFDDKDKKNFDARTTKFVDIITQD